jgi:hypothetical protein
VKDVHETIEKLRGKHEEDMRSKRGSLKQLMKVIEATERGTSDNRVRWGKQLKDVRETIRKT